ADIKLNMFGVDMGVKLRGAVGIGTARAKVEAKRNARRN
ncbi:hypothetical protein FHS20_005447, partial [Phyllobacterium endophyticum]|nr:hypothetical protein [Phyllobacterium endophyticum]